MKIFALLLMVLASPYALAVNYEVTNLCSATPAYSGTYDLPEQYLSVGKTSMNIFDRDGIPYVGAEKGMNSILNTPIGEDAIEILNRKEMRVYGWCYKVNDQLPLELTDEVLLTNKDTLIWFYGYSYYNAGKWEFFCKPVHELKPEKFCSSSK